MPRKKLTRLVLIVAIFVCLMVLMVNILFGRNFSADNYHESQHKKPPEPKKLEEQTKSDQNVEHISRKDLVYDNYVINMTNEKSPNPWFMANGTLQPDLDMSSRLSIWPEESAEDRIVNQLMFYPKYYDPSDKKLKIILLNMRKGDWTDLPMGRTKFISDKCPVNRCYLSVDPDEAEEADAILFKDRFKWSKHRRAPNQIWILHLLESPLHTQLFHNLGKGVFNWTATYRHDSDIVTPYEKFVTYNANETKHTSTLSKDWSYGKTKMVAWFVSNCGASNNRLEYAHELSEHIQVDIYGSCGDKECPRNETKQCLDMLNRDYRFYLAFENSNCRDYITEKFFVNGLGHNSLDYSVIPIVMGAHPNDYLQASPYMSYIHVDDFKSPKHLAQYLYNLSANPEHYNRYFEWKSSGEFINTYFWCRVCALLHSDRQKPSHGYNDISEWWAYKGVCSDGRNRFKANYKILIILMLVLIGHMNLFIMN